MIISGIYTWFRLQNILGGFIDSMSTITDSDNKQKINSNRFKGLYHIFFSNIDFLIIHPLLTSHMNIYTS